MLDTLSALRTEIAEWKPQIVFNLLEEFDGIVTYDQHVVAFLELLRQPYTGCNPRGLLLSRDKVLSKQLLAYHRIPTPQFAVFPRGARLLLPKRLRFPMFVKSATEDASLGIAQASVVEDAAQPQGTRRVHSRADHVGCAGRGVRRGPRALRRRARQSAADDVSGVGDGVRVAARFAARDRHAQGEVGQALPEEVRHHDQGGARTFRRPWSTSSTNLSRRIYKALHLSGYARMDFRLKPDGSLFVLEANANPNLSEEEDFADRRARDRDPYDDLLSRILTLA